MTLAACRKISSMTGMETTLRELQRRVAPPGKRIPARFLPGPVPAENITTREHRLALGRRNTSEYRDRLAERGEPETTAIARAMLSAYLGLLISGDNVDAIYETTLAALTRETLLLLREAGYNVVATKDRMLRLKKAIGRTDGTRSGRKNP